MFLLLLILLGVMSLCIGALRENSENYYKSNVLDNPINDKVYKYFVKFLMQCKFDIDMLCLKLPIQNRYAVYDAFKDCTDQMQKRVDIFIDQQTPLSNETIYDDYNGMIENMKNLVNVLLDKYPKLDKVKIYQYFSNMYDLIKDAIDEIVRKDTTLNGIDVTSRDAKCKSLGI